MKKACHGAIVFPLTLLLFSCATGRDTAPSTSRQSAAPSTPRQSTAAAVDETGDGEVAPAAALRRTLSEAVDDRSQWDTLHLLVDCVGDAGSRSTEVYGNGVGIWDYRRQFTLTPPEISSLLKTLDEADFPSFAPIYGGNKQPDPRPSEAPEEGAGFAIRVICRVALSLAGETKEVTQIGKGEQSAELKKLAEDLLAICEKPGQAGTAAADLADGLDKVSRGELAPETFQLTLYRKPETAAAAAGGGGFLLRLSGLGVTDRGYEPAAGLLEPLSLTLSPAEVADLARELVSLNLAQLPINLFALDYTDLSVEVLNHKKSAQARQFAGMTPATHGERQLDFDRIYDALYRLHVRVASEGEPAQ